MYNNFNLHIRNIQENNKIKKKVKNYLLDNEI